MGYWDSFMSTQTTALFPYSDDHPQQKAFRPGATGGEWGVADR